MRVFKIVAVLLHTTGAAIMISAWKELSRLPSSTWISKQKGGYFQLLTIQCLVAAWLTMSLSLISDFMSIGLVKRFKRIYLMVAMPLALMISVVYWSLLFLKPSLVLRRKTPDGLNPTLSVKPSDDLIRVPLHLDLAIHAVPGFVLLLDFFLFEQRYARDQARYNGAFVTAFASIWYGWWVEHCASFNGSFPYPFLTVSPFPLRVLIYAGGGTFVYVAFLSLNSLHRP